MLGAYFSSEYGLFITGTPKMTKEAVSHGSISQPTTIGMSANLLGGVAIAGVK